MKRLYMLPWLLLLLIPMSLQAQEEDGETVAPAQPNHFLEVGKNLDIFNAVYRNLDLLYVDTINPEHAVTAALKGLVRSLDPYTDYYPESDKKRLEMLITGKYAGIGALIKYHMGRKQVVIDEPYAGMPAAEAGVLKGDVILSIDDSLMTDKQVSYVSSRLRGDAGTSFLLRVLRPSTGKEMKFKITRRNIKMPELTWYGIVNSGDTVGDSGEPIGYINLNQFTEGCARNVRNALIDLKQQGAKSMILDLRGNGGGSEMEAVDLVSIWLPKDEMVVENRGKVLQANRVYRTRLEPIDTVMPLVVLVNGETASASEITAGALQDLDRAVILGTRTYGKGLVQVPLDMPYNSNVKITTSKYYIPSGRCIQAINYKKRRDESGERTEGSMYGERVPDSLTQVFHTRAGREVRDGGGLKPDLEVRADTLPNIAYYLSVGGLDSTEVMFDYVVDYIARHDTIASPEQFHLTDQDFQDFRERVIKSGFTYDPVSRKQFNELVKTAKFEGYYDDAREAFDLLSEKLRHDVAADLDKHRKPIMEMLESEIVASYYYQSGALRAGLRHDPQLREACRLLNHKEEYEGMLKP